MPQTESLETLLQKIEVPAKYGSVVERRRPEGEMHGVVVHIQQLPYHIEVDENIARMLAYLVERYGFEYIFLEGATGGTNLSAFEGVSPIIRNSFAKAILHAGLGQAADYFMSVWPHLECELWGVDDPDSYLECENAAIALNGIQREVADLTTTLRQSLFQTCLPLLSPDLRNFTKYRWAYDNGQGNLSQRTYLECLASYNNTLLSDKRITFPETIQQELNLTPQASAASIFSPLRFFRVAVDTEQVTHEVSEALCQQDEDRSFVRLLNTVETTSHALQLTLTPFQAPKLFLKTLGEISRDLSDNTQRLNRLLQTSSISTDQILTLIDRLDEVLRHNWNHVEAFYNAARNRSFLMPENVAQEMRRRGVDRAVFSGGGFHTGGVPETLALAHDIGTVTIMPVVRRLVANPNPRPNPDETKIPLLRIPLMTRLANFLFSPAAALRDLPGQVAVYHLRPSLINSIPWRGDETVLVLECAAEPMFSRSEPVLVDIAKHAPWGKVVGMDSFRTDIYVGHPDPASIQRVVQVANVSEQVSLVNANARDMPFKDAAFDIVINTGLRNIFNAGERKQVLREIVRVLRPGGRVILLDYRYCDQYARVLQSIGMSDVQTTPFHYFRLFPAAHIVTAWKPVPKPKQSVSAAI